MYNNGYSRLDRGHGHGLYIQNDSPTRIIKDCIIFNNFGWGIHAYTQGGKIDNLVFDGCICFNAGSLYNAKYPNILVGGTPVAHNITIKNCLTYGGGTNVVGYVGGAEGVILENNYLPEGIDKNTAQIVSEVGNTYGVVGNRVFLRPNDYDGNRANLVIYNQDLVDSIVVDVSSLMWNGTVHARNVQDYFNDIQILTVVDGNITIDMQAENRTVSTPVQWSAAPTTFPEFGCFVLEKV